MTTALRSIDAARWSKIGRRWSIVLLVLLTINLSLVAVAVRGYVGRAEAAGTTENGTSAESDDLVVTAPEEPHDSLGGEPSGPAVLSGDESLTPAVVASRSEPAGRASGVAVAEHGQPTEPAAFISPEPAISTPTATPSGDDAPPSVPVLPNPAICIVNPSITGGVIHYVVDGAVVSLSPGEYQRLEGGQSRLVVFHRGDDFENAEQSLEPGIFQFAVSEAGWELQALFSEAGEQLIKDCRQIEAP